VFNARGQIIPLFDSEALLGGEPGSDLDYVVVIDTIRGHAALSTTGVPEAIDRPNPVDESESADQKGMYVLDDGRIVTELNIDSLLESMAL
jgi:chemotaxis signal transduction protein